MNKIFKSAISLVLALSLFVTLVPTVGIAFAADTGDMVQFVFSPKLINKAEFTGTETASVSIAVPNGETQNSLFNYLEAGESEYAPNYYRNWKLFAYNTSSTANLDAINGMQVQYARATNNHYFAIKVKGFESGTYNIKLNALPLDGGIVGLYVLDNATYGNKTVAEITELMKNPLGKPGVEKIGQADFYGRVGTAGKLYDTAYMTTTDASYAPFAAGSAEAELGNISFNGSASDEYIIAIRYEGQGVLEGNETSGNTNGRRLSIRSLSFTKTNPAKNENIFGNYAAFIEKTANDVACLYLISAIDSLDYTKAGFNLIIDENESEKLETICVYKNITIEGIQGDETKNPATKTTLTYTPKNFGLDESAYLYVVKKEIPEGFAGQTIKFKPFAESTRGTVEGSTYQAVIKSN